MQLGSAQSVANTTLISIEIQFWIAFTDNSLHWYLITFRVFRVWVRVKVIDLWTFGHKRSDNNMIVPSQRDSILSRGDCYMSRRDMSMLYRMHFYLWRIVTSGLWLKKDFKIERRAAGKFLIFWVFSFTMWTFGYKKSVKDF